MRRGILCSVLTLILVAPSALVYAQDEGGMTVGGNVRLRTEYKGPFNYFDADGGEATSDDGTFMRTQIHFGWALANDIAVHVQLQDSRAWGTDSVFDSADADVDLKQAYVSLNNLQNMESLSFLGENDVDFHIGRITLPTVGDGYIVAANDWANSGPTSWDGFWLDSSFGDFDVDWLWADLQNTDPVATGAVGAAEGSTFWFLQAGNHANDWVGGDVYLSNYKGDVTSLGLTDLDMLTYGLRVVVSAPEDSGLKGLEAVLEYALQTGDLGANDIDADFMLIRASYALDVENLNPVFGIGLSSASGDGNAADTDVETWMQPLQWNHGLLGHYDLVANSNVEDLFLTSQVTLMDAFNVHLDIHMLTLDEESDGWYTVTAGQQAGATDDDLGTEIDIYATWDCGDNLAFEAGWSMFQAGDAVETLTTGGFDDNGNFFYVQMTVPFGDAN